MAYNWDFFQIPSTGVVEPELYGARSTSGVPIRRDFGMRISNFGSQVTSIRMDGDYTRTQLGAKDIGELANPTITYGFGRNSDPTANHNPYVWGSTVKRINDDEMTKLGLDSRNLRDPGKPAFDVMDTNKYPTEGWHSFGQKYDGYAEYNGVLK